MRATESPKWKERTGERSERGTKRPKKTQAGRSPGFPCSDTPTHASFSEELFDFAIQIVSGIEVAQLSLLVQQPHRRYARDIKLQREPIELAFAVEILRPGKLSFIQKLFQFLSIVVRVDAHNLEAPAVEPLIDGFQVRNFADARDAPGGPEIEEHNLAGQFLQINFAFVQRGEFEPDRSADHFKMLHHRPGAIDDPRRRTFVRGQF